MSEQQWEQAIGRALWQWVDRGDGAPLPAGLTGRLADAVARGRRRRRWFWLRRAGAAAAVAAGGGAAVLALSLQGPSGAGPGGSTGGGTATPFPLARQVVRDWGGLFVSRDPGLAWALAHDALRTVNAADVQGQYTFIVHRYLADFNRTTFLLTLTGPRARNLRFWSCDPGARALGRLRATTDGPFTLVVDGAPQPVTCVVDTFEPDPDLLRVRVDGPPLAGGQHEVRVGLVLHPRSSLRWEARLDIAPQSLEELQALEDRPARAARSGGMTLQVEWLVAGPTGTRIGFRVDGSAAQPLVGELRAGQRPALTEPWQPCRADGDSLVCEWSGDPVPAGEDTLTLELTHAAGPGPLQVPVPTAGNAHEQGLVLRPVLVQPEVPGRLRLEIEPDDTWALPPEYQFVLRDSAGAERGGKGYQGSIISTTNGRLTGTTLEFDVQGLQPPFHLVLDRAPRRLPGPLVVAVPVR